MEGARINGRLFLISDKEEHEEKLNFLSLVEMTRKRRMMKTLTQCHWCRSGRRKRKRKKGEKKLLVFSPKKFQRVGENAKFQVT